MQLRALHTLIVPYGQMEPLLWDYEEHRDAIPRNPLVIAQLRNGYPIGWCIENYTGFFNMFVAKRFRHQGVGQQLVREYVRASGATRLRVYTVKLADVVVAAAVQYSLPLDPLY